MPSALVFSSRAYQSSIEIDGTPFAFQSSKPDRIDEHDLLPSRAGTSARSAPRSMPPVECAISVACFTLSDFEQRVRVARELLEAVLVARRLGRFAETDLVGAITR